MVPVETDPSPVPSEVLIVFTSPEIVVVSSERVETEEESIPPVEVSEGFGVAVIVMVDVTEADTPVVEAVIEPPEASALDPVSAAVKSVVAPERLSWGGRSDDLSARGWFLRTPHCNLQTVSVVAESVVTGPYGGGYP